MLQCGKIEDGCGSASFLGALPHPPPHPTSLRRGGLPPGDQQFLWQLFWSLIPLDRVVYAGGSALRE